MNMTDADLKRALYKIIEEGYANSIKTEDMIRNIMFVHREIVLRKWAHALYGVQTYTDPSHQRMTPFQRLSAADKHINRELTDIAVELKALGEVQNV